MNLWVCADAAPFKRVFGGEAPPILGKEDDVLLFYAYYWWEVAFIVGLVEW
jgi:hypothetical protein